MEKASDYLDGDLPDSLANRVRFHLGLCDDCDGWLSGLWSTINLLRGLPRVETPRSLLQRIRSLPDG